MRFSAALARQWHDASSGHCAAAGVARVRAITMVPGWRLRARETAVMQVRYFVVDAEGRLFQARKKLVEEVWRGRRTADELGCLVHDELRLITVVCDEKLLPRMTFFLRVELRHGRPTDRSRIEAYEAMTHSSGRRYDHPAARKQFEGWPPDWRSQLGVALDVPICQLQRVGLGGPLPMSDVWGISLDKVLDYFELADG